jgi:ABC-type transport system involved in cytochrome bd biosynthesis fused ATPase/permease subunit
LRLLYGHLGYSTALLVLLLTPEAYLPLRNLEAHHHASADGLAAAQGVFAIIDTPVAGAPTCRWPMVLDVRSTAISLNKIAAAHPGRTGPVMAGLDLTIAPGDRLVLTGENGAGKTTLLSLLLRFIEPAAGVIMVGETDLASIPADRWRDQIGWLPQHPALFGWSVAENIALGRAARGRVDAERATAERATVERAAVERAAVLAGTADFIDQLPDGYDTVLDERARQLSAGQRQKIALARLFMRDAPLLLLDEPTAHLDPVSAAEVAEVIGTLAADRTVLVVTHRDAALFASALSGGTAVRIVNLADGSARERAVPIPKVLA